MASLYSASTVPWISRLFRIRQQKRPESYAVDALRRVWSRMHNLLRNRLRRSSFPHLRFQRQQSSADHSQVLPAVLATQLVRRLVQPQRAPHANRISLKPRIQTSRRRLTILQPKANSNRRMERLPVLPHVPRIIKSQTGNSLETSEKSLTHSDQKTEPRWQLGQEPSGNKHVSSARRPQKCWSLKSPLENEFSL